MDNIRGGNLRDYLKKYALTEKQSKFIMHQLMELLKYLGTHGIVHRDIKPENILVDIHPNTKQITNIKLADFGISRILYPGEKLNYDCGTLCYVAPEILRKL